MNPRDFGSHDAGFAAIERAHAGVAEAASILGLPSVEPEQVVVLLACILQPNHDSFFPVPEKFRWAEDDFDNSMASFMQRFLLNSTAVLTIKRRDSLDLSASANVDTVPTASMLEVGASAFSLLLLSHALSLQMLRWSPTKLADFFDACGLDGCRDVVKQKQLTGRNYVEGSMSQFIPEDVASVADRKAMEDLLADVKERAWSERRK